MEDKPKRELVLCDQDRELLEYLTEDIKDVVGKSWLKTAIKSHFKYMVNLRIIKGSSVQVKVEDPEYLADYDTNAIVELWWKEKEAKALEGMERCTKCGKMRNDVEPRTSYGIYAGKLCEPCCGSYRDNCGLDQPQGNPYTDLDEQIDPD